MQPWQAEMYCCTPAATSVEVHWDEMPPLLSKQFPAKLLPDLYSTQIRRLFSTWVMPQVAVHPVVELTMQAYTLSAWIDLAETTCPAPTAVPAATLLPHTGTAVHGEEPLVQPWQAEMNCAAEADTGVEVHKFEIPPLLRRQSPANALLALYSTQLRCLFSTWATPQVAVHPVVELTTQAKALSATID